MSDLVTDYCPTHHKHSSLKQRVPGCSSQEAAFSSATRSTTSSHFESNYWNTDIFAKFCWVTLSKTTSNLSA